MGKNHESQIRSGPFGRHYRWITIALLLFFLTGGTSSFGRESYAGVFPAPEFPEGLDWLNVKEPLRFSALRGKIVLLDFWTYGCINCMHNIPDLKRLQEEFPHELVVIGVHSAKFATEGRLQSLRNVLLRYGITYPVVNDPEFAVWQLWGPRAWPTLVLVDPAGKVSAATMGEGFYPQFKEIILSLRKEFSAKGLLDARPWQGLLKPETRKPSFLSFPGKVRVDPASNRLFVADSGNHRVLVIDEGSGRVLSRVGGKGDGPGTGGFKDGDFETAQFRYPQGMAVSEDGSVLYVADTGNHAIRKVDLRAGRVTTIAGTGAQSVEYPPPPGVGKAASLSSPWDVELDGATLYIAMAGSHQVWKMDLSTGRVEPVAGSGAEGYADGTGKEAELAQPSGLSLSADVALSGKAGTGVGPKRLYFADSEGSSIRYVELGHPDHKVGTLAGSGKSLFEFGAEDGVGDGARFQHPLGVKAHNGKVYVADTYNHRIREIDPRTREVRTLAGKDAGFKDGLGTDSLWDEPGGLDAKGDYLYVADTNNHAIRKVDLKTGRVTTLVIRDDEKISAGEEGGEREGAISNFEGEGTGEWTSVSYLAPVGSPGTGQEVRGAFPGAELLFNQAPAPLRLSAQEVNAGKGNIVLRVELPPGYKPTAEAFSSLVVRAQGTGARYLGVSPLSVPAENRTFILPFEFQKGETLVILEAAIAFCAEKGDTLCYVDRRRIEIPIRVREMGTKEHAPESKAPSGGWGEVRVSYTVSPPTP